MFVLKCFPGIVIEGVPNIIVSREVFPPPKCKGINKTSTQLDKEKNSSKDNLFVNNTFLLRIGKFFDHLFFRISDQNLSFHSFQIRTMYPSVSLFNISDKIRSKSGCNLNNAWGQPYSRDFSGSFNSDRFFNRPIFSGGSK